MQMQKWLASRHCATLKRFPTEKAKGEAVCIEREKKQKYNSSLLKRKSSEATTGSRKRRAGWPRADAVVLAGLARGRGSAPEEQSAEELDGSSTAGGRAPQKAGIFAGGAAGAQGCRSRDAMVRGVWRGVKVGAPTSTREGTRPRRSRRSRGGWRTV
jgi:hypothetical protein